METGFLLPANANSGHLISGCKGAVVFGHTPLMLSRKGLNKKGKGKTETQDQAPKELPETCQTPPLPRQDQSCVLSSSVSGATSSTPDGQSSSTFTRLSTRTLPSASDSSSVSKKKDGNKSSTVPIDNRRRFMEWIKWKGKELKVNALDLSINE